MQVEVQIILLLHLQHLHGQLQQVHLELLLEIFLELLATVAGTSDSAYTYSETSSVLTNASQANCALNSSTGAITTTDFGGSSTTATTYTFYFKSNRC